MTAPNVAESVTPKPSPWGAFKFKPLTPEEQTALDAQAAQKKKAAELQEAAKMQEGLAQAVVKWGTKWIAENGDKLPNGGPTYTGAPVSRAGWDRVTVLWAALSDGTYEYATRGPRVKRAGKGGGEHLLAGENVGNLERFSLGATRYRGVDLHVIVQR